MREQPSRARRCGRRTAVAGENDDYHPRWARAGAARDGHAQVGSTRAAVARDSGSPLTDALAIVAGPRRPCGCVSLHAPARTARGLERTHVAGLRRAAGAHRSRSPGAAIAVVARFEADPDAVHRTARARQSTFAVGGGCSPRSKLARRPQRSSGRGLPSSTVAAAGMRTPIAAQGGLGVYTWRWAGPAGLEPCSPSGSSSSKPLGSAHRHRSRCRPRCRHRRSQCCTELSDRQADPAPPQLAISLQPSPETSRRVRRTLPCAATMSARHRRPPRSLMTGPADRTPGSSAQLHRSHRAGRDRRRHTSRCREDAIATASARRRQSPPPTMTSRVRAGSPRRSHRARAAAIVALLVARQRSRRRRPPRRCRRTRTPSSLARAGRRYHRSRRTTHARRRRTLRRPPPRYRRSARRRNHAGHVAQIAGSSVHVLLQPSALAESPSSHCSAPATTPSLHSAATRLRPSSLHATGLDRQVASQPSLGLRIEIVALLAALAQAVTAHVRGRRARHRRPRRRPSRPHRQARAGCRPGLGRDPAIGSAAVARRAGRGVVVLAVSFILGAARDEQDAGERGPEQTRRARTKESRGGAIRGPRYQELEAVPNPAREQALESRAGQRAHANLTVVRDVRERPACALVRGRR